MKATDFNDVIGDDRQARISAAVAIALALDNARGMDAVRRSDLDRLLRQADTYPEWSNSEQVRFRHLLAEARSKTRIIGKDGLPE